MTTHRTLRLVTALVEQHPEFVAAKPDFFYSTPICPWCKAKYTEERYDGWTCTNLDCGNPFDLDQVTAWDHEIDRYLDLTEREMLAELWEVCRVCVNDGVLLNACRNAVLGSATLTEALLAAAEAALGYKWEEVA